MDIHDELVFEFYPEDVHLNRSLTAVMEDFPLFGGIPILVDTSLGPNLLDLKGITDEEVESSLDTNGNFNLERIENASSNIRTEEASVSLAAREVL